MITWSIGLDPLQVLWFLLGKWHRLSLCYRVGTWFEKALLTDQIHGRVVCCMSVCPCVWSVITLLWFHSQFYTCICLLLWSAALAAVKVRGGEGVVPSAYMSWWFCPAVSFSLPLSLGVTPYGWCWLQSSSPMLMCKALCRHWALKCAITEHSQQIKILYLFMSLPEFVSMSI